MKHNISITRWVSIMIFLISPLLISWSGHVHQAMTSVAVQLLPKHKVETWAPYHEALITAYCRIPDVVKGNPNSSYALYVDSFLESSQLTSMPEKKKPLILHAGDKSANNVQVYQYYTTEIHDRLKRGNIDEALKYMGTFLHFIQDSSCPAHLRYGAFTHPRGEGKTSHLGSLHFFKRFMPVPEKYQNARLHGMIDQGGFSEQELRERIRDYKPESLGKSIPELLATLQIRHEEMMAQSDRMLIPMLQARFNDDDEQFAIYGLNAAEPSVKLTADYMYTLLELVDH